jgi:membrane dipeptidase
MHSVFDWHCDTILNAVMMRHQTLARNDGQIDLPRLRAGGAFAQVFALFGHDAPTVYDQNVYTPWEHVLLQYDVFSTQMQDYGAQIAKATCVRQMETCAAEGKICALLSLEGGGPVDGNWTRLDMLYDMGVRILTPTWNAPTCFGYPNSSDAQCMQRGLTPFGKEAIGYCNDKGILIDVSHLSDGGFFDVAHLSKKPFIASHSCCRALCDHPRCLTDEMLHIIGDSGGICGVNFYSFFLREKSAYTYVEDILRHMLHIRDQAGIEALCFGSDFDGIADCELAFSDYGGVPQIIRAMETCFTDAEIELVCKKNALRVCKDVLG